MHLFNTCALHCTFFMFFNLVELNRYLLSAYCGPGPLLVIWDMPVIKTKNSDPRVTIHSLEFSQGFCLADGREFRFCLT